MSLDSFRYQLALAFILSISLRRTYSRRKGAISGIRRPSGRYNSIFDADKLLRMRDFQSKLVDLVCKPRASIRRRESGLGIRNAPTSKPRAFKGFLTL
jgi:hypothetical protein